MLRAILLLILFSVGSLWAQMPKGMYAWWGRPEIRQDLKLTPQQQRQIQMTVNQFRPRLIEIRKEVNQAEIELQMQFDHDPVDPSKANLAIERLIFARGDLTRTLSQLSLKLRTLLTEDQWAELQRRRPFPGDNSGPSEVPAPAQK